MPLEEHTFPVQALAFGPDGTTLTSAAFYPGGTHSGLEVDVGTGKPTVKYSDNPGAVLSLAFAPGGRTLAAAVQGRAPVLWDVVPWRERRRLEGHCSLGCALAIADDETRLATNDFDYDVVLWDVAIGRPRAYRKGHVEPVASLTFAPGGAVLASGGWDNTVRLWDVTTGKQRGVFPGHA